MLKTKLAIALPIIYLLAWVGVLEYRKHTGTIIRIKVEGYDPRDLLAGHYLQFRISLGGTTACDSRAKQSEHCLCYQPESRSVPLLPYWGGSCESKPSDCKVFLAGSCRYTRFVSPIDRYYIPESFTPNLNNAPTGSSIEVSLTADGAATLREFYVGDIPLLDYAKQGR